jgi:hypothetical protein
VNRTIALRATAFRKAKPATLVSDAYFARLPPTPDLPSVRLEKLPLLEHAHAKRVQQCLCFQSVAVKSSKISLESFTVRGKRFEHGVRFRSPSSIHVKLTPEYHRFVALVGLDDILLRGAPTCFVALRSGLVFKVFVDAMIGAESAVMRVGQPAWAFDVKIPRNASRISLVCMDAESRNIANYANWMNAGFVVQMDDPAKVAPNRT